MDTGVILLRSDMLIIFSNRAAERILSAGNGLKCPQGRLLAGDSIESQRLQQLVSRAVATAKGKGLSAAGSISISRRRLPALRLTISPTGLDISSTGVAHAVVFISDCEKRNGANRVNLSAAFRLTPAECRVAILLGDGLAPRKIAGTIGVSENTVRSQVKSIYSKIGVRRQAELIRFLLGLQNGEP